MSSTDVVFDYEGSLALARKLWALADELEQVRTQRIRWADHALESWKGKFAIRFRNRVLGRDSTELTKMVDSLRQGARQWGVAFAKAVDEQNLVLYTRETNRVSVVREERSLLEDTIALFHDDLKLPRKPEPCTIPSPPGFHSDERPKLRY